MEHTWNLFFHEIFFSLKRCKMFSLFFKIKDFFFQVHFIIYILLCLLHVKLPFFHCATRSTHTDYIRMIIKKYRRNMILQAWNCSWIHSMNQFHCWTYKKSTQENHTVKPDQIFRSQVLRLQTNTHYFWYLQTCIPNL